MFLTNVIAYASTNIVSQVHRILGGNKIQFIKTQMKKLKELGGEEAKGIKEIASVSML